ncbi:MAG: PQQ-binding-like beta-propeller repeat protein [Fimbriiglobus sp.]
MPRRFPWLLLVAVLAANPAAAADWPRFLGPNGDGSSPEKGILTAWPADGLKKLWDCPLGIGYAPPAVAAGKLYHFDRFGDANRVTCRDAATGKELWQAETPTDYEDYYGYDPGPRACPVIDGDRVYAYGPEGMLRCLSAADGKERWKFDTRANYRFHQNFFGVGSAPVIDGDLLLVAVGGSPKGPRPPDLRDAKPNGSAIVAFDKLTGAVKYTTGDDLASYSAPVVATLDGQRTGLYFARGGLLGFDPATGQERFRFPWRAKILESVNASNPVVVGDTVLVTESYEKGTAVVKVAGGKLSEVWTDAAHDRSEKALMGHWCTPIADGRVVYGSHGRHTNEGELRCVDAATGDVKWRERRTTRCTLLKLDGHGLSLGENGEVRLFKLNPAKYEAVATWEPAELEYPCWAPPAVSRGRLYLRGKGRLACYELIGKGP